MPSNERDEESFERAKELARTGHADRAIPIYEELLKRLGQQPAVLAMLGAALTDVGRHEEARNRLKAAVRAAPDHVDIRRRHASAARFAGRIDEAQRAIDKAIQLDPEDPLSIAAKADLFLAEGRVDEAADLLLAGDAPLTGAKDPIFALQVARLAPDRIEPGRAIDVVSSALEAGGLARDTRSELLMRLGQLQLLDGDDQAAFSTFADANALAPGSFDPVAHAAAVDVVIRGWAPNSVSAAARSRVVSERPVFIVGMPRSGTTLVERIIGAHPQVHAGGERSDVIRFVSDHAERSSDRPPIPMITEPRGLAQPELDRAAVAAMDAFGRLGGSIKRTTDKMPLNALHLGVIAMLFPRARIIYCTRDPRDTGLSCYTHWFNGYHAFTKSLEHIAAFQKDLERLMTHWRSVLSPPVLEVPYESIVEDLDGAARKMIDFLGLQWDDACLRYHEGGLILTNSVDQARKPIYASSVGRWRKYERQLAPLLEALA
jgi:lipoprotein NlpI